MIDRQQLLERFLRYVQIDTTANPNTDRYPSSDGQFELGRLLVQELQGMGLTPSHDEYGIVIATVPGNVPDKPVVALNSHIDTSPETSGANVKPHVIDSFDGNDIALGDSGISITVQENPELQELVGKTLITPMARPCWVAMTKRDWRSSCRLPRRCKTIRRSRMATCAFCSRVTKR